MPCGPLMSLCSRRVSAVFASCAPPGPNRTVTIRSADSHTSFTQYVLSSGRDSCAQASATHSVPARHAATQKEQVAFQSRGCWPRVDGFHFIGEIVPEWSAESARGSCSAVAADARQLKKGLDTFPYGNVL